MPALEEKLAGMTKSQYFEFEIVLDGIDDLENPAADAFYDAGCDDATLSIIDGVPRLSFTREAGSLQQAVFSALWDVRKVVRSFPAVQIVCVELPNEIEDDHLNAIERLLKARFIKAKDNKTPSFS